MELLIVLAILVVVVVVVSAPLRRAHGTKAEGGETTERTERASERAELEAAREAKYREIRDAELDHRTGKLSDSDYEAVDRSLRAEAIEILRALEHARHR